MFGRATITLGIGPHSSCSYIFHVDSPSVSLPRFLFRFSVLAISSNELILAVSISWTSNTCVVLYVVRDKCTRLMAIQAKN